MPDFENLELRIASGQRKKRNSEHQETSHHNRMKSSILDAITYEQTDCLAALQLLQNYWRQ